MIQQVAAFQVGQQVFPTIQAAQIAELVSLMCGDKTPTDNEQDAANFIVENTDEIVAILTCKPATKKPRSDKGTKRKPKVVDVAA